MRVIRLAAIFVLLHAVLAVSVDQRNQRNVRQRLNLHNRFTRTQTSSLITREELTRLADCVDLLAPNAPKQDVNAWKLTRDDVSFYLLGTFHYTRLWKMRSVETLIRFLTTTPFTSVFTELKEDYSRSLPLPEAAKLIQYRLADEDFHKIPDDETNAKKKKIALVRLANLKSQNGVEAWDQPLDNAFLSLVLSSHRDTLDPSNEAHYSALETVKTRIDAHEQNAKDNTPTDSVPNQDQDGSIDPVEAGNQQAIFIDALNDMRAGLDKASCVERNKQWVSKVAPAKGQLWIVGASHVPGLICHFLLEHGFTAEPVV